MIIPENLQNLKVRREMLDITFNKEKGFFLILKKNPAITFTLDEYTHAKLVFDMLPEGGFKNKKMKNVPFERLSNTKIFKRAYDVKCNYLLDYSTKLKKNDLEKMLKKGQILCYDYVYMYSSQKKLEKYCSMFIKKI